jgi:hypothetical protein
MKENKLTNKEINKNTERKTRIIPVYLKNKSFKNAKKQINEILNNINGYSKVIQSNYP